LEEIKQFDFTEKELTDLQEMLSIQTRLKMATNANKKDLQRALEKWKNTHIGPRWKQIETQWPAYLASLKQKESLERMIDDVVNEKEHILRQMETLQMFGFVEGGTLTTLGKMATEVNEGHPILMPILYNSGICDDLTAEEILSVLAVFVAESEKEDSLAIGDLNIPRSVSTAIEKIGVFAKDYDPDFEIKLATVEPIYWWLEGREFADVCAECGIYEGNFLRVVMKMGNILEEWRTMATICEGVAMLEKMKDIQIRLLRGVAVCESLYLRI
jgi:superfamily II RNA helicase